MRTRAESLCVLIGAAIGGVLVAPWHLQPGWAWGMAGGVVGGLLGGLSAVLATRSWPLPARVLAIILLLTAGFFLLWLVTGREWLFLQFRTNTRPA